MQAFQLAFEQITWPGGCHIDLHGPSIAIHFTDRTPVKTEAPALNQTQRPDHGTLTTTQLYM